MTSPQLPISLQARIASLVDGVGRAPLIAAQAKTSAIYRAGGHSDRAIGDDTAALAYAAVRMPATYAACVRAFDLAAARVPDFAPRSHLDLGAGPGTAALAAGAVWPSIASRTLVEPNAHLSGIGADLVDDKPLATWWQSRLDAIDALAEPADLVTLSYVLSELSETEIQGLLEGLRGAFQSLLVIVEPGSPHGYSRLLLARQALLALGAKIVAPCPHEQPCPLTRVTGATSPSASSVRLCTRR